MAISFVGSAAGATSATLPAHQAGDLIVGFAYSENQFSGLGLPSGYTSVRSNTDNNPVQRSRVYYKIAESSSETFSVTNAEHVIAHVYRSTNSPFGVGVDATQTDPSGTVVRWGAPLGEDLTLSGDQSWVVGFAYHTQTNGDLSAGPAGMVSRESRLTPASTASHDTNGTFPSPWENQSTNIGGSSGRWRTYIVEITELPLSLELTAQETTQDSFVSQVAVTNNISEISAQETTQDTFSASLTFPPIPLALSAQETTQDSFNSFISGLQFTVSVQGAFKVDEDVSGIWDVDREINTTWRRANVN